MSVREEPEGRARDDQIRAVVGNADFAADREAVEKSVMVAVKNNLKQVGSRHMICS